MRTKIVKSMKRVLIILLGCFISAISINAFIIPHYLLSGGVTGIALIINYLFKIPVGIQIIILNIPIFIVGLKKTDRDFIIYSLVGMVALSLFIEVTQSMTFCLQMKDPMLSAIAGGVIGGIGYGIIFRGRGSTGGSDIISVILNKKYSLSISTFSFMVNVLVIISGVIFNHSGVEIIAYTLISMYVTSVVITKVIEGFNYKQLLMVITDKEKEIADGLMNEVGRGITYLYGEGGYNPGKSKRVIICFLTITQIAKAKSVIAEIDKRAFVSIINTSEIRGNGFKKVTI